MRTGAREGDTRGVSPSRKARFFLTSKRLLRRLEIKRDGSKKANTILFSISRRFWPFYDNAGLFHKISEGN